MHKTLKVPDHKVKVYFHGALAVELCDELDAAVSSPFELLKLMEANKPGIVKRWFEQGMFVLYVNDELVVNSTMHSDLKQEDVIHVVPVVAGALFGIILGVIGVILAVSALALVFMRPPIDSIATDSTSFQTPKNVNREGGIVPVIYGTTRAGTILVSDNTFLGQTDTLTSSAASIPFINEGSLNTPGGSDRAQVISSETSTTQQIHVFAEGEISGLTLDKILLNGTPLETGGTRNFNNVRAEVRTGTDPQVLPPWVDVSAAPLAPNIDTDLSENRIIRTLNTELDAVRILLSVGSFFETRKKKPVATSVQLRIERRITGTTNWTIISQPIVSGEYFSAQQFQYTIPLDRDQQYDIAVSRITAEQNNEETQNTIRYVTAIEIKRDQVTYDGSAVLLLEYTNEAFGGQNPVVEVIPDGKLIKIPSNYDPVTRIYSGVWDGTYNPVNQFSNNGPLCIQDMLENDVYGLGEHLTGVFDRFNIFALAQFSDVMISDGRGGQEPRYTMNGRLDSRRKAIQVLRDMASVFRGSAIWDGSQVTFFTEQNLPVSRLVNQTQVIDGDFTYTGPTREASPNTIKVTYLDENNQFEKSTVVYKDHDSVRTRGIVEKEFEGLLTTSPSQALRSAKYITITNGLTAQYTGIEDQALVLPGEVTILFDPEFMGADDRSGRVSAATAASVTLDRNFTAESGRMYTLWCVLPDASVESRTITNSVGTSNVITVSPAFTLAPQAEAAWGIEADNLAAQRYIIQGRRSQEQGTYIVDAVQFNADKFALIEQDIGIGPDVPTTNPNPLTVPVPRNLSAQIVQFAEPNGIRNDIIVLWERPSGDNNITGYDISYSYQGSTRVTLAANTPQTTATLRNAVEGEYAFFVRSRTIGGVSDFATVGVTVLDGTQFVIGTVRGLELFNQQNDTEFVNRDAKFTWRYTSPITAADIGSEPFGANSSFVDDYFKEFVVRIFDTVTGDMVREQDGIIVNEYTYSLERNVEDGGPRRTFRIEVSVRNKFNNESDPAVLVVSNPAPALPLGLTVLGTVGGLVVSYTPVQNLLDYAETLVWISETSGFDPLTTDPAIIDNSNTIYADIADSTQGVTRFVRLALADTFGRTGLNISSEFEVTTVPVGIVDQEIVFDGFTFTVTNAVTNEIAWTTGNGIFRDGVTTTTTAIDAGTHTLASGQGIVYIYWEQGNTTLSTTNVITDVYSSRDNRTVAVYRGGTNLQYVVDGEGVFTSGDLVLAGTVGAAQLVTNTAVITGSAQISDGIITNVKVGNIIQSNNYNGTTNVGWQIDKSGIIRGRGIEIYDNSGALVFGSGTTITVGADGTISGFPSTGAVTLNGLGAGDFAFVDQITAANISTYIASAAIGNTYIGTAAILEANIGDLEVSRLKIANGSVTQIATAVTTNDATVTEAGGEVLLGDTNFTPLNAGNSIVLMDISVQVGSASAPNTVVRLRGYDGASPQNTGDTSFTFTINPGETRLIYAVFRFAQSDTTGTYRYGMTVETSGQSVIREGSRTQMLEYIK